MTMAEDIKNHLESFGGWSFETMRNMHWGAATTHFFLPQLLAQVMRIDHPNPISFAAEIREPLGAPSMFGLKFEKPRLRARTPSFWSIWSWWIWILVTFGEVLWEIPLEINWNATEIETMMASEHVFEMESNLCFWKWLRKSKTQEHVRNPVFRQSSFRDGGNSHLNIRVSPNCQ